MRQIRVARLSTPHDPMVTFNKAGSDMNLARVKNLLTIKDADIWGKEICEIAADAGFEQTLFGMCLSRHDPLENAFIKSNYDPVWRERYDHEKLAYVDPTVAYSLRHNTPLLWTSHLFTGRAQKQFYEEACGYGLTTGLFFPIHGVDGEFGVFSFSSSSLNSSACQKQIMHALPELALLRDFAVESAKSLVFPNSRKKDVFLTKRERVVLQWLRDGKSSWEIGRILSCSEATVNFHTANLRHKFGVRTRQQVVVKAIQLGLIPFDT